MAALWILAGLGIILLLSAVKVLKEYERGVIFRLGRLIGEKGPGLIILIPLVDRMTRVSLRIVTMDVPPQDVITRDNVSVTVNAVAYFRVMDPTKAIVEVENYLNSTRNPNLKMGKIEDKGNEYEVNIETKDGSLVNKILVNKDTGWLRSAY